MIVCVWAFYCFLDYSWPEPFYWHHTHPYVADIPNDINSWIMSLSAQMQLPSFVKLSVNPFNLHYPRLFRIVDTQSNVSTVYRTQVTNWCNSAKTGIPALSHKDSKRLTHGAFER